MTKLSVTSTYISAANALHGKQKRRRIVAYVESYDDVLFWRTVLSNFENEERYFEVMLPTRNSLSKGKKKAIMSMLSAGGGKHMIACVDADYDYLLQGRTETSKVVIDNPYVFHTYVYAIENYQCYAHSLHNVCVMATLNDHAIFDFTRFFSDFSEIIFPLFVWNILLYRTGAYHDFTMTDMNHVLEIGRFPIHDPQPALEKLSKKVNSKLGEVRRKHPGMKEKYEALTRELEDLGITPQTTYLYIQGHHLFDTIVVPLMHSICDQLRYERERDIKTKAVHTIQMQNELSAYQKAQSDIPNMLKKNFAYFSCPLYRRIIADVEKLLNN